MPTFTMAEMIEFADIISAAKYEIDHYKTLNHQSEIEIEKWKSLYESEKLSHLSSLREQKEKSNEETPHPFSKEVERPFYAFDAGSTRTEEDRNLVLRAVCLTYKHTGQKSMAQRTVRDLTGWSLKECQDYVDNAWGIKLTIMDMSAIDIAVDSEDHKYSVINPKLEII